MLGTARFTWIDSIDKQVRMNITLSAKLFRGKYKITVITSILNFFIKALIRDLRILYY
jgi:hypothetical protein